VSEDETYSWSPAVERAMKLAGWFERRRVDTKAWRAELEPEGFVMHPAAQAFLAEFGGLSVNVDGPGRDFARTSFDFDPIRCSGQKSWFDSLSGTTAGQLYPLGEEQNGNASFAIDADGMVYMLFNYRIAPFGRGRAAPARLIEGEDYEP
jgi:hypothetical protein